MEDNKLSLTIGWLYPDLMSTYGDRGNVICLQKRCQWRGFKTEVKEIEIKSEVKDLGNCDLLFMGGAQDRQQKIAADDLYHYKGPIIKKMVENGVPGLFICGAYQFMGDYYQPAEGEKILGLGIFDLYTKHPGFDKERCVGNIIVRHAEFITSVKASLSSASVSDEKRILKPVQDDEGEYLVGFENHGGRTYLGKGVEPLGEVVVGYGNNGEDKTEGCFYKNAIGTYLHGPILPKNPHLADWLIKIALEKKYQNKIELEKLDDALEEKAHEFILRKLRISSHL